MNENWAGVSNFDMSKYQLKRPISPLLEGGSEYSLTLIYVELHKQADNDKVEQI